MAIENYIKKAITNIANQDERRKEREAKIAAKTEKKLNKLLDVVIAGKITQEQYVEMATDIIFAAIFGEDFFDELEKRETEWIEEAAEFDKLSVEEIQSMPPIDIAKYTKDYIDKKGLFQE